MILCTPRISNNFWNEHRIRTAEFPVSILSASEPGCDRYRFPRGACDAIILACISDDKKFGEHEVQYQSLRSWMFWFKNKRFKSQWTQLLISPWSSTPSPWLKLQSGEVYNNDAVIANRSTVFSETVFVRLERSVHFGDMMAPLLTSQKHIMTGRLLKLKTANSIRVNWRTTIAANAQRFAISVIVILSSTSTYPLVVTSPNNSYSRTPVDMDLLWLQTILIQTFGNSNIKWDASSPWDGYSRDFLSVSTTRLCTSSFSHTRFYTSHSAPNLVTYSVDDSDMSTRMAQTWERLYLLCYSGNFKVENWFSGRELFSS
jgi:hypothetical protein